MPPKGKRSVVALGYVVGIAGGSASGKSTLSAAVRSDLEHYGHRVEVVSYDRFMHSDMAISPTVTLPSGEVWFDRNHPESADTAAMLSEISARQETSDLVIVEGHLVLAIESIRATMDLAVYVELEDDARALRRMLRDMKGGRGNPDPAFIAEYYLTCAKPGHDKYIAPSRARADLVIRGDAPTSRSVQILSATLRGLMKTGPSA